MTKLSAYDEIIRAKVQLQKTHPFFSYLVLHLVPVEAGKMMKEMGAPIGVDAEGTLYYDPDEILKFSRDELKSVLVHEAMHLVLLHLLRAGSRDKRLYNVASDIVVNDMLKSNGFHLPSSGCITDSAHKIRIGPICVENVDKKTAEEIYNEIYAVAEKVPKTKFDIHMHGKKRPKKGEESEGMGAGELEKEAKKWKGVLAEASSYSRQRGLLPSGMERIVGEILHGKVSWRHRLYKFITSELPVDFSYMKPHKKSFSTGFYMPYIQKEKLECVVAVDTSGSIQEKEFQIFMSEIYSISKAFPNVSMTVLICDAKIQDVIDLNNATYSDIKDIKIKGGGGTSHTPIVEWINKNKPTTRVLISLTDGYSDIERAYPNLPGSCKNIIVLPQGGKGGLEKYGEVINIV